MSQRIDAMKQSPELFKRFVAFSIEIEKGSLEPSTLQLVKLRASQINGCTFCLDMHSKEAKIRGERELRLHHLATWRESSHFTPRERAALEWTELLTRLPEAGVPQDAYDRVRAQLADKELSDLSFAIMSINGWNRINVALRTVPGSADKMFGLDKAKLA